LRFVIGSSVEGRISVLSVFFLRTGPQRVGVQPSGCPAEREHAKAWTANEEGSKAESNFVPRIGPEGTLKVLLNRAFGSIFFENYLSLRFQGFQKEAQRQLFSSIFPALGNLSVVPER
jgi:hypothetical protein